MSKAWISSIPTLSKSHVKLREKDVRLRRCFRHWCWTGKRSKIPKRILQISRLTCSKKLFPVFAFSPSFLWALLSHEHEHFCMPLSKSINSQLLHEKFSSRFCFMQIPLRSEFFFYFIIFLLSREQNYFTTKLMSQGWKLTEENEKLSIKSVSWGKGEIVYWGIIERDKGVFRGF